MSKIGILSLLPLDFQISEDSIRITLPSVIATFSNAPKKEIKEKVREIRKIERRIANSDEKMAQVGKMCASC
jgi:hypothetical protein